MDYETVSATDFGRSLKGLGVNLLVRDVKRMAAFLRDVFGIEAHRLSEDFAIMIYAEQVFQLHSDATYHSHPLPSLLPEAGPRGGGVQLYLFEADPDEAVARAQAHDHDATLLHDPANKPHGLRECVILCENGYAWTPCRHLTDEEAAAVD